MNLNEIFGFGPVDLSGITAPTGMRGVGGGLGSVDPNLFGGAERVSRPGVAERLNRPANRAQLDAGSGLVRDDRRVRSLDAGDRLERRLRLLGDLEDRRFFGPRGERIERRLDRLGARLNRQLDLRGDRTPRNLRRPQFLP